MPQFQLGYMACEVLADRMQNPAGEARHILLKTELIGDGAIHKAVAQHQLPALHRRPDHLIHMLRAGSGVKQGFTGRAHLPVTLGLSGMASGGFLVVGLASRGIGFHHADCAFFAMQQGRQRLIHQPSQHADGGHDADVSATPTGAAAAPETPVSSKLSASVCLSSSAPPYT